MKLPTVVVGIFLGPTLCSDVILGESKKALSLRENLQFYDLPTDPSDVNLFGLATSGKDLDAFSLNEAMKRMGENFSSQVKAFLLNENMVLEESYEELTERAMGYGLTELLCALLFRYGGWKSEFDIHVYAASLYGKGWCPLEEWQKQDNLDWGINYQAIFKADNPVLLYDILFTPSNVFQKKEQLENWENYKDKAIKFIQEHLHRLIVYYDSARIFKALEGDLQSLSPISLDKSFHDLVKRRSFENDSGDLDITRFNWKLPSLSFKREPLISDLPHRHFKHNLTYAHIEYWVECRILASLDDDLASNIFERDYDWAMEMLHQRNLLGTSISIEHVKRAINHGSHKVLAWIYDHVHEWPQSFEGEFEDWIIRCPLEHLPCILRVHKSHFPQYRPSQLYVNKCAWNAEILAFFETFKPPLYPPKEIVDSWYDLNIVLRMYEKNPNWRVPKSVFKRAVSRRFTALVDHVLKGLPNEKVEYICSLQLIQHNARVDENYVPNENELRSALHGDGVALASWLDKQDRFKGLLKQYPVLFNSGMVQNFQAIKWLWENKKIKPSKWDLQKIFGDEDLNACKWALKEFEEMIRQLDETTVPLLKKETIQWWIENVNKNYVPDIYKAFVGCVHAGDVDSARWLVESWPLHLDGKEELPNKLWRHKKETVLDFIELIYIYNVSIFQRKHLSGDYDPLFFPSSPFKMTEEWERSLLRWCLWEMRCRPNLRRILMEHAYDPIPMDEWKFIASLPGLYGIDSSIVKRIEWCDHEVLALLQNCGLLHDLEEPIISKEVEGITKLVAEMRIEGAS